MGSSASRTIRSSRPAPLRERKAETVPEVALPERTITPEETDANGKENGYMTEYSDSGTVIAEGNYVNGLQDGDWKYRNGEYLAEGKFTEGKEDGRWKQTYPNGKLCV